MKILVLAFAMALVLVSSMVAVAAMDHAAHASNVAHEAVVDGVKATFSITSIAEGMRAKGLAVPKGMKDSHHLAAAFMDIGGKQPLSKGLVAIRVQGPGSNGEPRELVGMDGHFGIDLDLSRPGRYGIMCRFVLEDGKKRQAMFWYEVK